MRNLVIILICFISLMANGQANIQNSKSGQRLIVNGNEFFINGMNWDYYPIGTNYNYSIWKQPDQFIQSALDKEMSLLKNMGVNTIRVYAGIPQKWITYIYDTYGIYTILNHTFGRYGLTIDGTWLPNTEYADPKVETLLLSEVNDMTTQYKGTRGLLMYLLGNENNYGLFWEGAETENVPIQDRKSTHRAEAMYKLFDKAAFNIKNIDSSIPVAICNGDLLFLDLIAKECNNIDVLGINAYRGTSFTDLFQNAKKVLNKPIMFTEFGADALNAQTNAEDQEAQAYYLTGNWKEIYENAAGLGKSENCIGGFTFQFSDGWWKYKQTSNLDIHDDNASWSNGGYIKDFVKGENNMNEEWFGICAKGATDEHGQYDLFPRSAYYVLQQIHGFNPYDKANQQKGTDTVAKYFETINLTDANLKARGDKATAQAHQNKISLNNLRAEFTTFNTGGSLITTPKDISSTHKSYPNQQGFDHLQSYYIGVEANPITNMRVSVNVNVVGHIADNPIDQIFYENRGRSQAVVTPDGTIQIQDLNRVQIYKASYDWNHKWFDLKGFYRTGHYHWGYEGDFFGLYQEANYGPNIDIYNGEAPFGFEMAAKKKLDGLKVAFGPELWWGANPAFLAKYSKKIAKFDVTAIFHEDLDQRGGTQSSFAIPQPKTRRTTLTIQRTLGKFGINLGGIWAGQPLNGRTFQVVRGTEGNYQIYQDQLNSNDNWGGKLKLMYTGGKFNWYAQGAIMGLVANGGADNTQTFTGWRLKDSGSGNQYNFLSGATLSIGKFQIAPNFLWQKPIEGPIPANVPNPGRPRNILEDPFSVRANRETVAGEILFTYDPTPATWMHQWDNDKEEDASFAFNTGFIFRHLPTTQDAAIGIFPDGRTTFAFPGAAPATDLWEAYTRIISKVNPEFGLITNIYTGTAQANGSDTRKIMRFGADIRTIYHNLKLITGLKINDWGPYDYHRDYNLTFPLQLIADLSLDIKKPDWWMMPSSRIGLRGTFRTLDQYSPRYAPTYKLDGTGTWVPDPTAIGYPNGNEWEIRTYILFNITK
ncbi:MAG: glycosidase [Saprospiraceae bacterium]|nr:glycosidase [Saprospiraceae bacterium]